MESKGRGPRVDPQPGDHLHRKGKRFWFDRWVKARGAALSSDVIYCDQYGQTCACSIRGWRKWAATAEVIRTAEVAE